MAIDVIQSDITVVAADAIVNAANETLLGPDRNGKVPPKGGGVDGAIHRAAGHGLMAECMRIPEVRPDVRCPTGDARLTASHRITLARHIIHTVGPVWQGGDAGEPDLLAQAYRSCLELATQHRLGSIAFPAISCGAFGFPPPLAVSIAVSEVLAWKDTHPRPARVIFCCADRAMAELYRTELAGGSGSARYASGASPSAGRPM